MKGQISCDGKPTGGHLCREDSSSPTASLESILLAGVVDAQEGCDVMTTDISNAFIQAPLPKRNKKVIVKTTGKPVGMLVNMHLLVCCTWVAGIKLEPFFFQICLELVVTK